MLLLAHLLVTPASTSQLDCFQSGQVAGKFGVLKKPRIGVIHVGGSTHVRPENDLSCTFDISTIFTYSHVSML